MVYPEELSVQSKEQTTLGGRTVADARSTAAIDS